jgi:hypothetical protein
MLYFMNSCISWGLANWNAVSVLRVTYTVLALMMVLVTTMPDDTGCFTQNEGLPMEGGVQL